MAITNEVRSDFFWAGTHNFGGSVALPANTVVDGTVNASDPLGSTKTVHRHAVSSGQALGADVATQSVLIHIARAAGTLDSFEVVCDTAPTGGDKQFTVDLHKGNASTAFATVLSSVVTMNSSDADRTIETATLSTTTYADGDQYLLVVTASGSTGSQGDGFVATMNISENPT